MNDVEALQFAPFPKMPPQRLLQLLRRAVLALQKVAHEQRAAGLHEGAYARHVVFVLAVAGPTKDIEQLVALAVILRERNAMVEYAVCTLGTHPVRKVNAKEPSAFLLGVALVGLGVTGVFFEHTAVRSGLPVCLVVHVAHVSPVPQVVLVGSLRVVLLGIHKVLLFARRPGQELGVQVGVLLRRIRTHLATTEPTGSHRSRAHFRGSFPLSDIGFLVEIVNLKRGWVDHFLPGINFASLVSLVRCIHDDIVEAFRL
mmetsp:Transcript_41799/g.72547  ORF Transcript_41799/g.72547 Transcript_41799/m.72547 type:complete len:257 (+) Transcript_41799:570-1340(+)